MRCPITTLLLIVVPMKVVGQLADAAETQRVIEELVAVAEAGFECEISVLTGAPRFDGFSQRWLANYSAVGDECDETSQELYRQGLANDILFARRPALNQLMSIVRPMIRSAESAFGCQIALRGTPRMEPVSGQWSVTFLASGEGCVEAEEDLRDQGRPLQIFFIRLPPNQTLMR